MKKLLTLLLLCFALCINAQHMKFMGISMGVTIEKFHQSLIAKGLRAHTGYNAVSPIGGRAFKGLFCGYDATIHVYYNAKTKIVYRAKAVIDQPTENQVVSRFSEFEEMINNKYSEAVVSHGEQDGYETRLFLLPKRKTDYPSWSTALGCIGLYIGNFDSEYSLHIDYIDIPLYDLNEKSNSDDL